MQRLFPIACLLALAGCVLQPQEGAPSAANPLWRTDATHLAADRSLARACLDRVRETSGFDICRDAVQAACLAGVAEDARSSALERMCDWRAIAAWEDEIAAALAELRLKLTSQGLLELAASQRAWQASMLADVALNMDLYPGGSLAGPLAAHVRAEATASRAAFLEQFLSLIE